MATFFPSCDDAIMTNRNSDNRYETPEQVVPFMIEQWCKQNIHTSTPGIVVEYYADTKRAWVQPAIRRLIAREDSPAVPSIPDLPPLIIDRPPMVNVPVKQTSTGGYMIHQQIDHGDVVWLQFSERGIDSFKAAWGKLVDPPIDAFFSERDAVAIPWGVESIQPVQSNGIVLQNASGSTYISLEDDAIRLVVGGTEVVLTAGGVAAAGGALTHNGTNVGDTHTHQVPHVHPTPAGTSGGATPGQTRGPG